MNLSLKTCTACGKQFIPGQAHIYNTKDTRMGHLNGYQCSYGCFTQVSPEYINDKVQRRASNRRELG